MSGSLSKSEMCRRSFPRAPVCQPFDHLTAGRWLSPPPPPGVLPAYRLTGINVILYSLQGRQGERGQGERGQGREARGRDVRGREARGEARGHRSGERGQGGRGQGEARQG